MNKLYRKSFTFYTLIVAMLSLPIICNAEFTEEEAKIVKAKKLNAIRVYPDILTNLTTKENSKNFKYILLRIDLIVIDSKDEEFIKANKALIRDKLILFLNKQTKRNFATKRNKARVKKKIILVINNALETESKKPMIKDIIIQKLLIE